MKHLDKPHHRTTGAAAGNRNALIGAEIRQARRSRGMTQDDLAKRVDISVPTISKIENGKQVIDVDLIWRIGDALNVSPSAILLKVQRDQAANNPIELKVLGVLESLARAIEGPGAADVTW